MERSEQVELLSLVCAIAIALEEIRSDNCKEFNFFLVAGDEEEAELTIPVSDSEEDEEEDGLPKVVCWLSFRLFRFVVIEICF